MNVARIETVRINFIMNILQEKLFDLEEVLETISFCFFLSGLALVKCSGEGQDQYSIKAALKSRIPKDFKKLRCRKAGSGHYSLSQYFSRRSVLSTNIVQNFNQIQAQQYCSILWTAMNNCRRLTFLVYTRWTLHHQKRCLQGV